MKNNIFLLFLFFLFLNNFTNATEYKFITSEIKILDEGNNIEALNGKAISEDNEIEIQAEKFEYRKDLQILKALNGLALFKPDNIEIEFQEIQIDQKNSIISTTDVTKIRDINRNLSVETKFVNYDKKNKILESNSKSILKDKFNNSLSSESFNYDIKRIFSKFKIQL